jgi:hypothetical protein
LCVDYSLNKRQSSLQFLAFVIGQFLKDDGSQPILPDRENVVESLGALAGQLAQHLPAVGWMWTASDETRLIERLDCDGHRLRADTLGRCEIVRTHGTVALQVAEHREL